MKKLIHESPTKSTTHKTPALPKITSSPHHHGRRCSCIIPKNKPDTGLRNYCRCPCERERERQVHRALSGRTNERTNEKKKAGREQSSERAHKRKGHYAQVGTRGSAVRARGLHASFPPETPRVHTLLHSAEAAQLYSGAPPASPVRAQYAEGHAREREPLRLCAGPCVLGVQWLTEMVNNFFSRVWCSVVHFGSLVYTEW